MTRQHAIRGVLLPLLFGAGVGLVVWPSYQPTVSAQIQTSQAFNRCLAVTTSDTADLPPFAQAGNLTGMVYVGGAGNVTAVLSDGSTILFTAPPVGAQLPIAVRRINATSTTATAIVACYRL